MWYQESICPLRVNLTSLKVTLRWDPFGGRTNKGSFLEVVIHLVIICNMAGPLGIGPFPPILTVSHKQICQGKCSPDDKNNNNKTHTSLEKESNKLVNVEGAWAPGELAVI